MSKIELILNDDGSVNVIATASVCWCEPSTEDISFDGDLAEVFGKMLTLTQSHTIERCAKKLDVFAVGSTGTTQVAAGHLAKAIRSIKTGEE